MTPVDEMAAAAGEPLLMHTIGEPASPGAVVARWRHDGAELDIRPSDIVRVTIGLQDGVPVRQGLGTAGQRPYVAALGGITVTPARTRVRLSIDGPSDVLQLFLRVSFLESVVDGPFDCFALVNSRDGELRAAAMQLMVAATRRDRDDPLLLESAARRMGARLQSRGDRPSNDRARGGLARVARRFGDLDLDVERRHRDRLARDVGRRRLQQRLRAFELRSGKLPHLTGRPLCNLKRSKNCLCGTAASAGGFNRSMQHTNLRVGDRSVADEATATNLLFRQPEGADVGALEARLDAQRDWQAL